ncbi:mitotic spindle organizing protein 1 [Kwoniella heveanensis BCC8398]|uniref:Mitotic-spindle organizing protein 1 n=1 Tax=Kwoniella heveanensis BCC8398 TaxID=1296120 RepID=A0A1B9H0M9_9TREE|nr:mitotic spindle organizing protein 1 [Kwoniella heveanensis BCC8398]
MSSAQDEARLQNARETIDCLDKNTLSICVGMIEQGANPDTLAAVIKELRRENEAIKTQGTG